jgi:hypothetical protein
MRRPLLITVAVLGVVGLVGAFALGRGSSVPGAPYRIAVADRSDLSGVAGSKIFFAHQSVGYNLMGAVPGVFERAGLEPPPVIDSRDLPTGPAIFHTRIGRNGDPLGKITEFDRIMRAGMADAVDVAILKLCYVDFHVGTDVAAITAAYRGTLAALARDYPGTAFVAATVPLTTERGPLGRLKAAVGRGDTLGPEHNVVRQRFNDSIRHTYGRSGELFDIAAIESTSADGRRVAGRHDGDLYYALATEYASDPGHLNARGAAIASSALLSTLADAARRP